MRLMIVTRKCDGEKIYVNPAQICAIYPYYKKEDTTVIQFSGEEKNYIEVAERAKDIADYISAITGNDIANYMSAI